MTPEELVVTAKQETYKEFMRFGMNPQLATRLADRLAEWTVKAMQFEREECAEIADEERLKALKVETARREPLTAWDAGAVSAAERIRDAIRGRGEE